MPQVSNAFVADPELIVVLEKRARSIELGSNRVLFRQGDAPIGVFILRKGTATLTRRLDDEEVLTVEVGAGSLLGMPAVIGAKPYSLTAEAMEGAELSLLTCEYFVHLMHTEPGLSFRVLQVLAEEVRFAREALSHPVRLSAGRHRAASLNGDEVRGCGGCTSSARCPKR